MSPDREARKDAAPGASAPPPLVLVIDDEEAMRRLLDIGLAANGYQVRTASTGQAGLVEAATRKPDFVVLDLGLPDMDGLAVLARIREWSRVPVIILSVRGGEEEKIAALDGGADDYLTKPFSVRELLARIRVAARHAGPGPEEPLFRSGGLEVDLASRRVTRNGGELRFTATEYALLACLVRHAGRVVTHRQILKDVWGPAAVGQTHYLRVYVRHLREKIESEPSRPALIMTESGVGYRLVIID